MSTILIVIFYSDEQLRQELSDSQHTHPTCPRTCYQSRTYNSFAGSDIKAIIGQFQFAELQAISYAISREKAPIYTMGSPDPRAYSRNKRGIAGNLIWIQFDRHALLNLFHQAKGRYVADVDEIRPQFWPDVPEANAPFASSSVRNAGLAIGDTRSLRPTANRKASRGYARDTRHPPSADRRPSPAAGGAVAASEVRS